MRTLSEYITEALRVVKKDKDFAVVQVVDRNFGEGVSDEYFIKFLEQDIKACFKLSDSQLNKDYDKVVEELIKKEWEKKEKFILQAADKYKRETRRDQYIQSMKDQIRQEVTKRYKKHTIDAVWLHVDPEESITGALGRQYFVTKPGFAEYVSGEKLQPNKSDLQVVLEKFRSFGYVDGKTGERVDLSKDVIGWTIEYGAYPNTECPMRSVAGLRLKLNKEAQDYVDRSTKRHEDSVAGFYGPSGNFE